MNDDDIMENDMSDMKASTDIKSSTDMKRVKAGQQSNTRPLPRQRLLTLFPRENAKKSVVMLSGVHHVLDGC